MTTQAPPWHRAATWRALHHYGATRTLPTASPSLACIAAVTMRLIGPRDHVQEDLDRVAAAGLGRVDVTVGSALDIFGGKLPYASVVSWHRRRESSDA